MASAAEAADRFGPIGRLLRPRSIAFVGGEAAAKAVEQCRALGFDGALWPVNPRRAEVGGVAAFDAPEELPGPPDAAFVAVNRDATIDLVGRLARIGTGVAVCHASGFAEVGADGADRQFRLVAAADGMPIIGPNCYGTISAVSGAVLWPDEQGLIRTDSGISVVTQSGNIAVNLTMHQRAIPIAHVLTVGNQCDIGIEDCLHGLVDDPHTTGIALHIEALTDVASFASAAARAAERDVPVVALKTGVSSEGATIAVTHTGSMVGDDAAYTALFERFGVRRVASIPELLDTLHVMDKVGSLAGARLTSLSCSGGEASLVADRARAHDVEFPPFGPDHADRIRSTLSDLVGISNPLDYHTFMWGDEAALTDCFEAVLDGPFDAAMLLLDFPRPGIDPIRWWPALRAFGRAVEASGTPGVVTSTMAETMPAEVRHTAASLGLAVMTDIDATLRALEAAAWFGVPREPVPVWSVPPVRRPTRTLDEHEAKQLLRTAGVDVPAGEFVPIAEAAGTAGRIGFPVVVKATGVAHKSDVGGVLTGLDDAESVGAAAIEVTGAAAQSGASGRRPQVLVEQHVTGVAELLVAVRRADPVGYLLTLGAGGSHVELAGSTRNLLLPVDAASVGEALRTLPVWPLLTGHRGRAEADVGAIIDTVLAVGHLARARPEIVELELNPVIVSAERAVAADALLTLEEP